MQTILRNLTLSAVLLTSALAHAATASGTTSAWTNGIGLVSGTSNWTFSSGLNEIAAAFRTDVYIQAPAIVTQMYEYDPVFEIDVLKDTQVLTPLSAFTFDTSSKQLATIRTTGGVLLQTPALAGVSYGGSFAIQNMAIDLSNKRVYASITGNFTGVASHGAGVAGGAVTTIDNFYLWDFASLSGSSILQGSPSFTAEKLRLTTSGLDHIASALRLYATGRAALTSINDTGYGLITTTLVVTVPEPSTYALALAGIALVAVTRRRRTAH